MTEQRPLKVFLCHVSVDKPAVRRLYRYLRERKMDPWLDAEKLLPGQKWRVEIPKALLSSDVIIICLSKNSVDKEGYVQKEIKFALDKALEMPEDRVFLIPARLEDCDVPESLKSYEWVDLFKKNWNRRLMQSLNERASQLGLTALPPSLDDAQPPFTIPKSEEPSKKINPVEPDDTRFHEALPPLPRKEEGMARSRSANRFDSRKIRIIGFASTALLGILAFSYYFSYVLPVAPIATSTFQAPTPISYPPTKTATLTPKPPTATFTSVPPTSTFTAVPPTFTPTPGIGSTMVSAKDGMTLVFVPAVEFAMGSELFPDEKPIHKVNLDSYWIDQTEVTNAMYAKCVQDGKCKSPTSMRSNTREEYYGIPEFEDYPVIFVDWNRAKTYCEWAGRRLPTEAEWENVARGIDARTYPWGEGIDCDKANYTSSCFGDTTMVGSYIVGKSSYGAFNMAGNVLEWVTDWYNQYYYVVSVSKNPQGPAKGQSRVLRGGSWRSPIDSGRSSVRYWGIPDYANEYTGFRCALSE